MARHNNSDSHDYSITEPKSAPPGQATPKNIQADAESFGESTGGLLGGIGGASLGILGGPVGAVLGGLAGALGGWWAGREIADLITEKDEAHFRNDYEASSTRFADRRYEDVRPAYIAGHLAARNPDYAGRSFDEIEPDLRRGWTDESTKQVGEWPAMRGFARSAYLRNIAKDRDRDEKR